MKKPKRPAYKNIPWTLGLKKKREQDLFFEIENVACSKIYGDYPDHLEIIKVLRVLIRHNYWSWMVGKFLDDMLNRKKKSGRF